MNSNDPAGLNLRVGNPWTLNGAEGGMSFRVASIWALVVGYVCVGGWEGTYMTMLEFFAYFSPRVSQTGANRSILQLKIKWSSELTYDNVHTMGQRIQPRYPSPYHPKPHPTGQRPNGKQASRW